MDTAFMRKTFALIAKGLIEKEQLLQTEPTRYPYSKALQHGINMFLAASQWAGSQAAVEYPDEASFLAHFITRPVEEWFDTWESGAVEQLHLQEEPFYAYDAFAYQKAGNIYVPSSDCYEFLETQDSDIMNGTGAPCLLNWPMIRWPETPSSLPTRKLRRNATAVLGADGR